MAKTTRRKKSTVKKSVVALQQSEITPSKTVNRFPKRPVIIGVIVLVLGSLIYFGKGLFIAAVVNGQPISRISVVSELENRNGKSVLNEFVINSLIEQEAKRKKINVSDKEVSDELVKIEQSVNSQGATLDDLLAQQGMTKDSLKSAVKVQLLATKLVNNNIKVTDKEINDYINTQKAQLTAAGGTSGSLPSRDQAKSDLVQQKLQSEIQTLITDLKNKAKISYFVGY